MTIFDVRMEVIYIKKYSKFVTLDQFLCDLYPKQILRMINFKMSDCYNINNDTTSKTKSFQRKEIYENRRILEKLWLKIH